MSVAMNKPYYQTHEPPHCPSCDCGADPTEIVSPGQKAMAEYYVVTRGQTGTVHGPFADIEDAFSEAEAVAGQLFKGVLVVELKGIVKPLVVIEREVFD